MFTQISKIIVDEDLLLLKSTLFSYYNIHFLSSLRRFKKLLTVFPTYEILLLCSKMSFFFKYYGHSHPSKLPSMKTEYKSSQSCMLVLNTIRLT